MRPFQANLTAVDTSYLAAAQTSITTGGAVFLTLNSSNRDYSYVATSWVNVNDNTRTIARRGSITSTGNVSALTFTFYGLDVYNQPLSETITGPNNATVATTGEFLTVTGIQASTGFSANVTAGRAAGGTTIWWIPSWYAVPFNCTVDMAVTNTTVYYTIQHTPNNLFTIASFSSVRTFSQADTTLVNTSSSGVGNYAFPVGGIRAVFNTASTTTSGTAEFYVHQAGV